LLLNDIITNLHILNCKNYSLAVKNFFIFKGENNNIQIEYSICSLFYTYLHFTFCNCTSQMRSDILLLCVVPLLNLKKGVDI